MQLRQKYTKNNITYENEIFVTPSDNINAVALIEYFFGRVEVISNQEKVKVMAVCEKDEESAKEIKVVVKNSKDTEKEQINKNKDGYYIKCKIENNIVEKWSRSDSEEGAKASIYNYVSRLKKERGYAVSYEFLEIKPMSFEEYNNRKSE